MQGTQNRTRKKCQLHRTNRKKLLVDQYDALQAAIVHSTKKMALYQPYLAEWHYTEFHHLVD